MKFNVRVQRCYYNEKFKECVLTREQCFKLGQFVSTVKSQKIDSNH